MGTVDKFQGQEAPVVIYSMATSRPEDSPRGMEDGFHLGQVRVRLVVEHRLQVRATARERDAPQDRSVQVRREDDAEDHLLEEGDDPGRLRRPASHPARHGLDLQGPLVHPDLLRAIHEGRALSARPSSF